MKNLETASHEYFVASGHPALRDHFPARPVIPAALILDAVRERMSLLGGRLVFKQVKFLQPALPDIRYRLLIAQVEAARFSVELSRGDAVLMKAAMRVE